jgi:glycosyltransferase involved in cell wall biosynthesis
VSEPRPVRVLHVLMFDALAGTELMVASLVTRSDPAQVTHELATLQAPGPIVESVRAGSRWAVSLGGRGGLIGAGWRLARLLRTRPYDVVNAYGLKASVLARVLVRVLRPGAAFVCGIRGIHLAEVERADSPKAWIAAVIERLLAPLVDFYDANSRGAVRLLEELGIDGDRLVYIPNGLDLSLWSPPASRGVDGKPPLILCAARFVPLKRHNDLLEALAALRRSGRSFRAVLAGDGPTLAETREAAARLGLGSSVEFPGRLGPERLRGLLGEAAIACLQSTGEGMPGSVMEAMASGVPVVATDVSGTNELVVDGETGLLVPAYDPPALAEALAALLDDPELRARLAAGARTRMDTHYSLEAMLAAKQRLYRTAAGR